MKKLCFIFALILAAAACHSSSVEWGVASFWPTFDKLYGLGVQVPAYGASADADIAVTTSPTQAILKNNLEYYTIGYGIVLLQVDYNTLIDQDLLLNSSDPFFSTYPPYPAPQIRISETDVIIPLYETVYLAFAWGGLGSDLCGWVALTYDDTGVHLVGSAMDMTRQGIYAGTGITVPEPSIALLALSGLSLLLLRRRCRK